MVFVLLWEAFLIAKEHCEKCLVDLSIVVMTGKRCWWAIDWRLVVALLISLAMHKQRRRLCLLLDLDVVAWLCFGCYHCRHQLFSSHISNNHHLSISWRNF